MSVEVVQPEIWFFPIDGEPYDEESRAWWSNPKNPDNPLSNFVGNEAAVRRLCRTAFAAMGRYNRECSDQSFALLGPPSTGKATLARMFGQLVHLPFVEIDAHSCNDLTDIAVAIAKVLEDTKITGCEGYPTLELQDLGGGRFVIPPCIVFIDGVHNLPKKVALRQAVAGRLSANGWTFETTHVCWIVAATDEDLLPVGSDAFTKLRMKSLSVEEVAKIVAIHNPEFSTDVCLFVAQQVRLPRDALAFSNEMRIEFEMHGGDWQEVAAAVARDWGVQNSMPWVNRLRRN